MNVPWHDRLVRSVLAQLLPYPNRFRFALRLGRLGKPFKPLLEMLPLVGKRLGAMVDLAPARLPAAADLSSAIYPCCGQARRSRRHSHRLRSTGAQA